MNNVSAEQQKFIKKLLAVAPKYCDNCGSKYNESDFNIVKTNPTGIVIHLKCHSCSNSYMLNVMPQVNGMIGAQRTPFNLDLDPEIEIPKFAGKEAVNKEDALYVFDQFTADKSIEEINRILNID